MTESDSRNIDILRMMCKSLQLNIDTLEARLDYQSDKIDLLNQRIVQLETGDKYKDTINP